MMDNNKGLSLAQIVVGVIIATVLATVVGLYVVGYIKDARLAQQVLLAEEVKTELLMSGEKFKYEEVEIESLKEEVRSVVGYHQNKGTNLEGVVFENKSTTVDGNVHVGELLMPEKEMGSFELTGSGVKKIKGLSQEMFVFDSTGMVTGIVEEENVKEDKEMFAVGGQHVVHLTENNEMYVWGDNGYGQLGSGNHNDSLVPQKIEGSENIKQVASLANTSLYLTDDGRVYGSGEGRHGQLGNGRRIELKTFEKLFQMDGIIEIKTGYNHGFSLMEDGDVFTWGMNGYGQLGVGFKSDYQTSPVKIVTLKDVVDIEGGQNHSVGLDKEGNVFSWGYNNHGELGIGGDDGELSPVKVEGVGNVTRISAGAYHNVAVDGEGALYAWGRNNLGQLGDGSVRDRRFPKEIVGVPEMKDVSAGYYHSIGLSKEGDVYTWGRGSNGQLGHNGIDGEVEPRKVEGLSDIKEIHAGYHFSMAQKDTGEVYFWGMNSSGQYGDGDEVKNNAPKQVNYNFE